MNTYEEYIQEIEERKKQGLSPKPIDGSELIAEVIAQIKDSGNEHRKESLNFLKRFNFSISHITYPFFSLSSLYIFITLIQYLK